jgi:hypothetical protein
MLVASTSVVGFGFRSGKLKRVNVFRFALESGHSIDAPTRLLGVKRRQDIQDIPFRAHGWIV